MLRRVSSNYSPSTLIAAASASSLSASSSQCSSRCSSASSSASSRNLAFPSAPSTPNQPFSNSIHNNHINRCSSSSSSPFDFPSIPVMKTSSRFTSTSTFSAPKINNSVTGNDNHLASSSSSSPSAFVRHCQAIEECSKNGRNVEDKMKDSISEIASSLHLSDPSYIFPATVSASSAGGRGLETRVTKFGVQNIFLVRSERVKGVDSLYIFDTNNNRVALKIDDLAKIDNSQAFTIAESIMSFASLSRLVILLPEHDGAIKNVTKFSEIINQVGLHTVVGPSVDAFVDILLQRPVITPEVADVTDGVSAATSNNNNTASAAFEENGQTKEAPILTFPARQEQRKEILQNCGGSPSETLAVEESSPAERHLTASWNYLRFAGMNRTIVYHPNSNNFGEYLHELVMPTANVLIVDVSYINQHSNEVNISVRRARNRTKNTIVGSIQAALRLITPAKRGGMNIIVPTRKADRELLREMAFAVSKMGRYVQLVYPRDIDRDLALVGTSDVIQFTDICESFMKKKNQSFSIEDFEREALRAGGIKAQKFFRSYRQARHAAEEDENLEEDNNNNNVTEISNSLQQPHQQAPSVPSPETLDAESKKSHQKREQQAAGEKPHLREFIANAKIQQQNVNKKIDGDAEFQKARERLLAKEREDKLQSSLPADLRRDTATTDTCQRDEIDRLRKKTIEYLATIYDHPLRYVKNKEVAKNMEKYCVMVWSANAVRAFRRTPNPVVNQSFIEKCALYDYRGNFMPPLQNCSKRGEACLPPLDDFDVLVVHGSKEATLLFDSKVGVMDRELRRFLQRGGKVWCTATAEYCLTGYLTEFPKVGLHDLCLKYGATVSSQEYSWSIPVITTQETDQVLAEASQFDNINDDGGVTNSQVEQQMKKSLEEQETREKMNRLYKSQTEENDTTTDATTTGENGKKNNDVSSNNNNSNNTSTATATTAAERTAAFEAARGLATVFTKQVDSGFNQAQLMSLQYKMDAILLHAEIERNGIHISRKRAQQQMDNVKNELQATDGMLKAIVPEGLPVGKQSFDWNNFKQVEAYFFGGTISVGTQRKIVMSDIVASAISTFAYSCGRFGFFKNHMLPEAFCRAKNLTVRGGNYYSAARNYLTDESVPGGCEYYDYKLVLFDLETTGLDKESDRIVEFSFFEPATGRTFTSLVNPLRRIPDSATRIHNISDDMVKAAPSFSAVAPKIRDWLGVPDKKKLAADARKGRKQTRIILMSHSCASLDYPVLTHQMDIAGCHLSAENVLFADSFPVLNAAKEELKLPNVKLQDLVTFFKIDEKQINDVAGMITPQKYDAKAAAAAETKLLQERREKQEKLVQETENLFTFANEKAEKAHKKAVKKASKNATAHRAEYDTKALWKVLQAALKFSDLNTLFAMMAETVLLGDNHCFKMHCSEFTDTTTHTFHGLIHQVSPTINQAAIDKLKIKTINSTDVAEMFAEAGIHAAQLLLRRQKLQRSITIFDRNDSKLGTLHPDSRIRQEIRVASTSTGRTASCFPNCQNIPKDDKSHLREVFTSRYGPRGLMIEVDFKQLEIAVLGLLAQDAGMIQDLYNGVDFHLRRVEVIKKMDYDVIYKKYKDGDKEIKAMRQKAKTVSFQRMYGAGASAIQKTTGLNMEAVKAMIATEEVTYPGVAEHHKVTRSICLRRGNPGTSTHYILELPTGARIALKSADVNFGMPPVKNYPIQGYGAELVSLALAKIYREFVLNDRFNGKACIINFVHDSVWLDCDEKVAAEVIELVSRLMSSVREVLKTDFPGAPANVNFGVSASMGRNLYDTYSPEQWFASAEARKVQEDANSSSTIGGPSAVSKSAQKMANASSSAGRATAVRSRQSLATTPARKSSMKRPSATTPNLKKKQQQQRF